MAKRVFAKWINQSDSYVVQHLPESTAHSSHPFSLLRSLWTQANSCNDIDLIRLLFIQQTVEEIIEHPIHGAFAEVGVYKGNSAKLFSILAPDRDLYLFDTFQGFDPNDVRQDPKKTIRSSAFLDTSLEEVKAFVGNAPTIHYCPGYFPHTSFHVAEEATFALVHLDTDLYQPILAGLAYFYPRLAPGGIMIIHDYASGAWPGVKQAVDEFLQGVPEKLIRIPDKSGTVVFRRLEGV